ncbi:MFS general substrate transporter [Clohesyomyces aquaticus]|uniref:MFS general substrate transporter n=1 Tax=Clohesyomyces aquaticus TaxID=1231657 RepID=A0A1Y2A5H0_9PLEO|nr:MFS general substrate transporter [Clohesyomyces aquaticus]
MRPDTPHPAAQLRPGLDIDLPITGEGSPGFKRSKAMSQAFTQLEKTALLVSVFLVSFAFALDKVIRVPSLNPLATSAFNTHYQLATINTLVAVTGTAFQPVVVKIMDVFGRLELVFLSVILYSIGTIIEATSNSVPVYCFGSIIYNLGCLVIFYVAEAIVSDISSPRSQAFFAKIPALPLLATSWLSGTVGPLMVETLDWRWSIGILAAAFAAAATPLMVVLLFAQCRVKKQNTTNHYRSPLQLLGFEKLSAALLWQLDIVGMIILMVTFSLILMPFTLAKEDPDQHYSLQTMFPPTIGVCLIAGFFLWETYTNHPTVPFKLLKHRSVWAGMGIALTYNIAFACQTEYLWTVLRVSFDQTVTSANRITTIYTFAYVITVMSVSVMAYYVKRLKPLIVTGACLYFGAFALMVVFRNGDQPHALTGVISAQVLFGIASGMFTYPIIASIQGAATHAQVIGMWLAVSRLGTGIGYSLAGALWVNLLPKYLNMRVTDDLVALVLNSPFEVMEMLGKADPIRLAILAAYNDMQWVIYVAGLFTCVPLIILPFLLWKV